MSGLPGIGNIHLPWDKDPKASGSGAMPAVPAAPQAAVVRGSSPLDFFRGIGDTIADKLHLRAKSPLGEISEDVMKALPRCMQLALGGLPNVGEIGDATAMAKPAVIRSPEFGASSALPMVLEVPVAKEKQGLLEVGKKVHEKFFADKPPFNFNVNFSCANAEGIERKSDYADPRSPWFNVFFGRYQIDAPVGKPGAAGKAEGWDRPFGFKKAGSNEIEFDDILKIGKADWGYFSNWMYGVPEADLDRIIKDANAGRSPVCTVTNPSVMINGESYVECTVDGVMLPSAYVNGKDGKKLGNNDAVMSEVWRNVFGKQKDDVSKDPKLAGLPSFAPTEMKMKFYLRQEKHFDPESGRDVYSTQIYGGGVNKTWAGSDPAKQAYNERFLEAQMAAVKETMPR